MHLGTRKAEPKPCLFLVQPIFEPSNLQIRMRWSSLGHTQYIPPGRSSDLTNLVATITPPQLGQSLPVNALPLSPKLARAVLLIFFSAILDSSFPDEVLRMIPDERRYRKQAQAVNLEVSLGATVPACPLQARHSGQAKREPESSRRCTATSWIPASAGMTICLDHRLSRRRHSSACLRIQVRDYR
jgi:hypothetical protein